MNLKEQLKAKQKEQKALFDAAMGESRALTADEQAKFDTLETDISNLEKTIEAQAKMEARKQADEEPVNTPTVPAEPKSKKGAFRTLGEQLNAVRIMADPSYRPKDVSVEKVLNQLGHNEGVGSEGGFLVQTDFVAELLRRTYETGALASRARRIPVSANANGLVINGIDEDDRSTGSRWGGIQSYWLHEAGTKTPSQIAFRQIELKLKKLIGLTYATDELLQDTTALESIISAAFTEEFAWMIDDAVMNGNGVGQPQGFMNSNALVTVDAEAGQAANTILFENIVAMWSRMWARSRQNAVWFINQDIEPQLMTMSLAVGVGGVPVYLPAGGASAAPYATLMGRPVIPIEQASSLGNAGDITLVDLSQYAMIDKSGIDTAQSIHVAFVTDQTAFRFVYRCDGQSLWQSALTPANGNNTLSPFVALADRL